MSIAALVDIVHADTPKDWTEQHKKAFSNLFGASGGRYPKAAEKGLKLRAPSMTPESGISFAAYIHSSNPDQGAYGGFSFVMFPSPGEPCLIGLVAGTQGLMPDEGILGRPGHARKARAICAWLNRKVGQGNQVAWAKHDPTRTDMSFPAKLRASWPAYESVFERYGSFLYAVYRPTSDREATRQALTAFLDLTFEERGHQPVTSFQRDCDQIRSEWFDHLMPTVEQQEVHNLLQQRKYVILHARLARARRAWRLRFCSNNTAHVAEASSSIRTPHTKTSSVDCRPLLAQTQVDSPSGLLAAS